MPERHGYVYKDFTLYPRPVQHRDDNSWSTAVHIMRGPNVQAISVRNTWPSEEEALRRCLELGRRIIDGELPDITVDHL
jgi:hypothetical protein